MKLFIEQFKNLGLQKREAETYISLVKLGAGTAPRVAKLARIPPSKIYHILECLARKGFAVIEPGYPMKFRAVKPGIAVKSVVETAVSRLKEIESSIMSRMPAIEACDEERGIWVIRGRETVYATVGELISRAKETIIVKRSRPFLEFDALISGMKERGVKVMIEQGDFRANMINVDGCEMVLYSTMSEAVWIRDKRYCAARLPEQAA